MSCPNAASRGEVFCKSFRRKAGRFAKILRRIFDHRHTHTAVKSDAPGRTGRGGCRRAAIATLQKAHEQSSKNKKAHEQSRRNKQAKFHYWAVRFKMRRTVSTPGKSEKRKRRDFKRGSAEIIFSNSSFSMILRSMPIIKGRSYSDKICNRRSS